MEWIVNNWYLVIAGVAIAAMIIVAITTWLKLPNSTQIENLKEWLKFAVTEAEKALGAKTGQLKLRMVYDMALAKFPWLAFVSFDEFSKWVDDALKWLNAQLASNAATQNYVGGSEND